MATAAIGAGASILSGALGGKGVAKAAKIQAQSAAQALAEQQRQFNTTQANEAPFLQTGTQALNGSGGIAELLGLHGSDAQASAIAALKGSPLFTSQYNTGADTILQNAAATGGLRGGNTQGSLANFGSSLLSTVIQNQLGNLGGLASMGQNAAGGLATAGQSFANAQTGILTAQGNANALGAAAPSLGFAGALSGIGQNAKGLLSLLGGGTSGGTNGGGAINLDGFNAAVASGNTSSSPLFAPVNLHL